MVHNDEQYDVIYARGHQTKEKIYFCETYFDDLLANGQFKSPGLQSSRPTSQISEGVSGKEAAMKPIALCRINTKADEQSHFTSQNSMNIYIHKGFINLFPKSHFCSFRE